MKTHKDLKSVAYIEQAIHFAEGLLNVQFTRYAEIRYSSLCPFHNDTKDSFKIYVDGKDEVRFHCFGECKGDWDIYDVIMLRKKCSFREAQQTWAKYLEIQDFKPFDGDSTGIPEPESVPEPDETVEFIEPAKLDTEICTALDESANFYNDLLVSDKDGFSHIFKYLYGRGLDKDTIRKFKIGYAPPFGDDRHEGRALIDAFLPRFEKDYKAFQPFYKGSLVRLLNDESAKGYGYYCQQIGYSRKDPFSRCYGDYFTGRITFPIYGIDGQPVGIIGRRPDNRGVRWLKQQTQDTAISTKAWLYGIDKASRYIQQYKTVILVEGIFDYFAFYNLLQDQNKPVVVSTLGSHFTDEVGNILNGLGVENFIVAYDCDKAGQKGIQKVASSTGSTVYYLGGLKAGQDPYDKLKFVNTVIDGFSLKHLVASAKKAQEQTDKPVNVHFITRGRPEHRSVVFEATKEGDAFKMPVTPGQTKDFTYSVDDFLPLLTYDHGNKAMIEDKLKQIRKLLESGQKEPESGQTFTIPVDFIFAEDSTKLGASLILWLRIAIQQQTKKRRVKETDATLAEWLNTSRATISSYKRVLYDLGFLNINTSTRPQHLSVRYFPKQ